MKGIRNITVFCSSSDKIAAHFLEAADELGRAIAAEKWSLIYGGNRLGMMGRLADAARAGGATVVGITPQCFVDDGYSDDLCHELIVTADIRQRKALLEERGDAIVVLPGGIGTMEEFFEVLVAKALGRCGKPLVLVDIDEYFAPLVAMIEHGIERGFIRGRAKTLYSVATSVHQVITYLRSCSNGAAEPI